jgi:hypothetical protein
LQPVFADRERSFPAGCRRQHHLNAGTARQYGGKQWTFAADPLVVDACDLIGKPFQQLAINLWCVVTLHLCYPKPLDPYFMGTVHQYLGHVIASQPIAEWS